MILTMKIDLLQSIITILEASWLQVIVHDRIDGTNSIILAKSLSN
jgi:hypothetical protein